MRKTVRVCNEDGILVQNLRQQNGRGEIRAAPMLALNYHGRGRVALVLTTSGQLRKLAALLVQAADECDEFNAAQKCG